MFRRFIASSCPSAAAVRCGHSSLHNHHLGAVSSLLHAPVSVAVAGYSSRRWCTTASSDADEEQHAAEFEECFAPAVGALDGDRSDVCISAPELDEIESDSASWYVVTQRPDKNLVATAVEAKAGRQLLAIFGGFGAQLPIEDDGTVRVFSVPDRLGWVTAHVRGASERDAANADEDGVAANAQEQNEVEDKSTAIPKRGGSKKRQQKLQQQQHHQEDAADDKKKTRIAKRARPVK